MSAAIALLVFGAVTVALSLQLPLGTLRAPGSGFFPLVLGVLLAGLAALQAIRVYLERPASVAPAPADNGAALRVVLFMGVVALATALLQTIGYVAFGLLLMLGLLRVLGAGWGASALIAAGSAIASYFLFVQWLRIPMPAGPLGF